MSENQIVINDGGSLADQETYAAVRQYIVTAQKHVNTAVNFAMVTAYWNIGKQIYEACGESERAEYGKLLFQYLADKLTSEFGKGFNVRNLQMMRQFYLTFPNANALRSELSWTHYRSLMRVEDEAARQFYLEEAVKCGWSSRQLDRLPEDNKQIFAAKYLPYMPTKRRAEERIKSGRVRKEGMILYTQVLRGLI